jgi:hypothetical protein
VFYRLDPCTLSKEEEEEEEKGGGELSQVYNLESSRVASALLRVCSLLFSCLESSHDFEGEQRLVAEHGTTGSYISKQKSPDCCDSPKCYYC